ncbi:hypothetical protein [Streptomyces platensis]|uniref:hypothetical protein n=1 Tax=Streptomyces platensis TaxID=58346 RepID=UPI00332FF98D
MTTPKAPAPAPPVCGNNLDPRVEEAAKSTAEYLHGEPWADMPEDTRAAFREHASGVSFASELVTDLAQMHLRSIASPLPQHPAAFGWQVTAGGVAALAARLLDGLMQVAPERAEVIAGWYGDLVDHGSAAMGVYSWIERRVAVPAGADIEAWVDEAQRLAVQAKVATEAVTQTKTTIQPRAIERELDPEAAQPSEDWDDCGACLEVSDMCRFHHGVYAGLALLREAAAETPGMTVRELLERLDSGAGLQTAGESA